ncbi:Regulatory protein, TetR [Sphingobium herbicidovorans NBRC 16415]|uniref:Regulatory protein, TetR n=1 Tax=Sphingobium herbicidovorans (strain ATCC 700291 / DSM 11019 / CCUG 56400 / KCTC 2939 / LMG 18315 / NBRC 16415 / MH) TaxID=1219045 RepID=A0A086PCA6_SPHHM|nr:TetR/AcrR family transcriptional regulator C-terminal domain-containing protein [Sphingobium herbicidovorans]KFG91024.1 Regulatory protein, TetR [Sphingobium herbicidovorans NBRC 16415]
MPRQAKRTVGRPRRLTLEAIVDAACEVGIAKLEMSLVAERLNTGVATLYGYVRGRDHLLELVAQRLVGQALIKDEGQSWQNILREHATITYRLFRSLPHLITNLMGKEPEKHSFDYSRAVLALIESRGVPETAAVNAYIEINQVVIGAAISMMRREALENVSIDDEGRRVLLPELLGDYRPTLERIIAGYQAELTTGDGDGTD